MGGYGVRKLEKTADEERKKKKGAFPSEIGDH